MAAPSASSRSNARNSERGTKGGAGTLELPRVERSNAVRRYIVVGIIAWTSFVVTDVFAAGVNGTPIEYLLAIRAGGVAIGAAFYFGTPFFSASPARLLAFESVLNPIASFLIALAAVRCGGLTSPLALGVAIATMMRGLLPAKWDQALPSALASALTFPGVLLVAAAVFSPVAQQLHSSVAVWTFVQNTVFLLLAAGVATAGSHMLWSAKVEIQNVRTFRNYRLIARIGSGGMGDVWLARQMPLERRVALKILKENTLNDPDAVRRFKREADAASSLTHPNTIRVFDFGASNDGVSFIAMELLDGMDLELLVERLGPLPPSRAVHLAMQICGSLAEAHGRGLIHCDLKPANLFVSKTADDYDFAKVLDFGLVKAHGGNGHTIEDVVRGTPAYLAPEILRGERARPQSDVYAMGAVLYWMVTGTVLFQTQRVAEFVHAHLERTPERPSTRLGRDVPPDLETVILTCLAKEPRERFADAKDLGAALARCKSAGTWPAAAARAAWEDFRPSLRRIRNS